MHPLPLLLLAWFALAPATPAFSQAAAPIPVSASVRSAHAAALAGRLFEAEAQAASDPTARKLFRWWRFTLSDPNVDGADIARFMAENPDWPSPATLALRAETALRRDPDHARVRAFFAANPPRTADGWLRMAEAEAAIGRTAQVDRAIRAAWVLMDGGRVAEDAFLGERAGRLRAADHAMRFERLLETNDREAAQRQASRLAGANRAAAEAALAIQTNRPDADARWNALTAEARRVPAVVLARLRALRRAERDAEAHALILAEAGRAEAAPLPDSAPAGWRATRDRAFWAERNLLSRRALRLGNPGIAYQLAATHRFETELPKIDAEFLAGFLALRLQNDPATAHRHFAALRQSVTAAISVARAEYWAGRAFEAQGNRTEARARYVAAAYHPSTFYGQLGAFRLGESEVDLALRLQAAAVPAPEPAEEARFRGRELARVASLLAALGDQPRARTFLLRLEETAATPADRGMAGRLAVDLGQTVSAIWLARRAATRDASLLLSGWPTPFETPETGPERALVLAIMRQESNFDVEVVSPAGARGVMQLMPATARAVGRQVGLRAEPALLTRDPQLNIALGSRYLADLLGQFNQAVPLAVAGYNAGPHRVTQWLAQNGDPRTGAIDPIDWIERIPFEETRNYVMRVVEGQLVYRALLGRGPILVAQHPVLLLAGACPGARC